MDPICCCWTAVAADITLLFIRICNWRTFLCCCFFREFCCSTSLRQVQLQFFRLLAISCWIFSILMEHICLCLTQTDTLLEWMPGTTRGPHTRQLWSKLSLADNTKRQRWIHGKRNSCLLLKQGRAVDVRREKLQLLIVLNADATEGLPCSANHSSVTHATEKTFSHTSFQYFRVVKAALKAERVLTQYQ